MEKRFEEILNNIINYLQRISINQNSELEKEYYTSIEQDAEKLLDINNFAILNVEIFEKVKIVFKMVISFLEDEPIKNQLAYFRYIINDLYYIFKFRKPGIVSHGYGYTHEGYLLYIMRPVARDDMPLLPVFLGIMERHNMVKRLNKIMADPAITVRRRDEDKVIAPDMTQEIFLIPKL
jgi:hypothetical protein